MQDVKDMTDEEIASQLGAMREIYGGIRPAPWTTSCSMWERVAELAKEQSRREALSPKRTSAPER